MNLLKKTFTLVACILSVNFACANSVPLPKAPSIKSDSYFLMDYETGEVLLSKNSDKIYSPASLTKLMTFYVLHREISRGVIGKNDNVKISSNAVLTAKKTDSSRMFLEIGGMIPLDDVTKGLVVQSGNDAAIAIAEHIAGTESNFAELMNFYAKSIGMNKSAFRNASGLPSKNHYSTSHDMGILMRAIIKEYPEQYAFYFSLKEFSHNSINQPSRNKLLFRDGGDFEGGKTGWHRTAKYCYVASVVKNGRRLIVSTLKAPRPADRFDDAVALSNYGFRFFENYSLVNKDKPLNGLLTMPVFKSSKLNVSVVPSESVVLTLPIGTFPKLNAKIDLKERLIAPIKDGDVVGVIKIYNESDEVARSYLVASENADQGNWYEVLLDEISLKFLHDDD
jgi:D-alanyl-D-alanine carboxypeptidase (penicillin-binding protein 5/6)